MWNNSLMDIEVDRRDRFDHTLLHIVAAAGAECGLLRAALARGLNVNAVNTAGQNFLHVLDPSPLVLSGFLPFILGRLTRYSFNFSKRDHNGRNILQALLQHEMHHEVMKGVFEVLRFRLDLMAGRDNLGCSVKSRLVYLARCASVDSPQRAQTISQILSKYYELDPASYGSSAFDFVPPVHSRLDISALEDQICQALINPKFEDIYGRNGLHCFAQLKSACSEPRPSQVLGKASHPPPRKSDRRQQNDSTFLYFDKLLAAGVDVTSYDKTGKTPLLALLYYQTYTEKDNDVNIKHRVTDLIKAGASVHSRDRNGETPLHIAVKRGIITACRVLLDKGANVNARQKDGKGIVRLAIEIANEKRVYKNLHIRIMTCISLVNERGADDNPDFYREWDAVNE